MSYREDIAKEEVEFSVGRTQYHGYSWPLELLLNFLPYQNQL